MRGQLAIHIQNKKLNLWLIPQEIIHSKRNKDINITPEIVNMLEENLEGKIYNIGLCNDFFFAITAKTQTTKDKWDKCASAHPSKQPINSFNLYITQNGRHHHYHIITFQKIRHKEVKKLTQDQPNNLARRGILNIQRTAKFERFRLKFRDC